jgi:hypothetical protein
MKPQRALRNARGKPEHQEEALFNKILCALLVKRTKEEPRERQKKRPQGGRPKDAFTLSIQDVLCGLCG